MCEHTLRKNRSLIQKFLIFPAPSQNHLNDAERRQEGEGGRRLFKWVGLGKGCRTTFLPLRVLEGLKKVMKTIRCELANGKQPGCHGILQNGKSPLFTRRAGGRTTAPPGQQVWGERYQFGKFAPVQCQYDS
ncbi:hypothetical protein CEXT_63231 [Caerostris extrusa]|uniref:Uncharacterized protein n=1 Tax=Caerostris extrusa TaxID=172846 RepID=A0AAV4RGL3_CAEEX|nr:hypothetical protein CEXT_63231 [Caerostris extrusa]